MCVECFFFTQSKNDLKKTKNPHSNSNNKKFLNFDGTI